MYILGLGGSLHDFSACIVKDGKVIVAIEEERITRVKHSINKDKLQEAIENNQLWKFLKEIPKNTLEKSVQYCLESANISLDDISMTITTDSNLHVPYVKSFEHLVVINHHMGHLASTFYPSSFDEAAILIVDGQGSEIYQNGKIGYETVTLAYVKNNKIKILKKISDNSVGHFYETITRALGFGILEDGKVMGLSSYGTDDFVEELKESYVIEDNTVKFVWKLSDIKEYVEKKLEKTEFEDVFQIKANIAYAAQKNLEIMMCHYSNYLYELTKCKNLCIGGGVGLNSVANGVIYEKTPFEKIFIQPAAGDNGLCIGAALYASNYLNRNNRGIYE
ncbi:MAG: carbamoyltransferase N-terminal domain-containing protein [Sarcina sp.]